MHAPNCSHDTVPLSTELSYESMVMILGQNLRGMEEGG